MLLHKVVPVYACSCYCVMIKYDVLHQLVEMQLRDVHHNWMSHNRSHLVQ